MFVAIYPEAPNRQLVGSLLACGYQPVPVASVSELELKLPKDGWIAVVVELSTDIGAATAFASKARQDLGIHVLIVTDRIHTADVGELDCADDFILSPIDEVELGVRMQRLSPTDSAAAAAQPNTLRYEDLELNTGTYQAAISGTPQDLTYMEYELLRFFVENPGRVWSREQILSKVWGYDYFGGSRTVDVHVRRLRAKLGEERSSWITTVRSVGYRFG